MVVVGRSGIRRNGVFLVVTINQSKATKQKDDRFRR